jgi:hypothetical protein
MSGYKVSGSYVTFCKEYRCTGYEMATAVENTTMTITSIAGIKSLGCGQYVAFPKGNMYCGCCYSWKPLDMNNRGWAMYYGGNLIELSLVCEGCSRKMSFTRIVSRPLCGAPMPEPKSPSLVKRLCKWWRTRNVPKFDPDYQWD